MIRHKRVLIAVRLVFLAMIASMAIPAWRAGTLSPVLPVILVAYLITNLVMLPEKGHAFFTQRIQAALLLFDIFVLVVSLACLEQYRQDLFLSMFLVVLLASASQKLTVSIGGFVAVAALYTWFAMQGSGGEADHTTTLSIGLPVLLVVAIYVGYVSESVARERRQRVEAEDRLTKELQGMSRARTLTSSIAGEADPGALFSATVEMARALLAAPHAALFWRRTGEPTFQVHASPGLLEALGARWRAIEDARSPLAGPLRTGSVGRVSTRDDAAAFPEWTVAAREQGVEESLLAPFRDTVESREGCLVVVWTAPHNRLPVEEEAAHVLVQQAGACLENAALNRLLSQARDVWQAAFHSIPTPVVIVGKDARIVQVNPAFMTLGEFDAVEIIGSSFGQLLEGASYHDGRPLGTQEIHDGPHGASRVRIPRLRGEFEVTKGPYLGSAQPNGGTVWVLRKLTADVYAG